VNDEDMADIDISQNRLKIMRDYSHSPSKTPSKNARDLLFVSQLKKLNQRSSQINGSNIDPYDPDWDSSQYQYSRISDFGFKKHYKRAESAYKPDIDNYGFRMIDQEKHKGVDTYITLWCTCDTDPDKKHYLCKNARYWTKLMRGDKLQYQNMKTQYEELLRGRPQSKQITRDIGKSLV
jgi:hypothetical protein